MILGNDSTFHKPRKLSITLKNINAMSIVSKQNVTSLPINANIKIDPNFLMFLS